MNKKELAKRQQEQIDRMTKHLKKIREFIGWKQKDLALRLGCTNQTISNLEDERKKISMSFIQCIAIRSIFNMEVEELAKRSVETKDPDEALELSAKSEQLGRILVVLLDTPESEVSKEELEAIEVLISAAKGGMAKRHLKKILPVATAVGTATIVGAATVVGAAAVGTVWLANLLKESADAVTGEAEKIEKAKAVLAKGNTQDSKENDTEA